MKIKTKKQISYVCAYTNLCNVHNVNISIESTMGLYTFQSTLDTSDHSHWSVVYLCTERLGDSLRVIKPSR